MQIIWKKLSYVYLIAKILSNKIKGGYKMETYEGYFYLKNCKNDYGDKQPLTIDCEDEKALNIEVSRIKKEFLKDGCYSIEIKLNKRM